MIIFTIVTVAVVSTLFVALSSYNTDIGQAISLENARSQEMITLSNLTISNGYIQAIEVKNLGSVTSQIRGFYIDSTFICDPSITDSNGAYISAQKAQSVTLQPVPFDPMGVITVSTARGVKAIEKESNLLGTPETVYPPLNTNYGVLRLNYTLFYYNNTAIAGDWQPGHVIPSSLVSCEWKITVTNVDTRTITLNQYSSLTLVSNSGGSQFPWYIKNPTLSISPGETKDIIYRWNGPQSGTVQTLSGFSAITAKVFLTMYGSFSDGTTYGQTIPFEAVSVS